MNPLAARRLGRVHFQNGRMNLIPKIVRNFPYRCEGLALSHHQSRRETQGLVQLEGGVLVLDGTTLDKPHARKMELVTRHWSGKHCRVVRDINLLTMLWTDGCALIPCDFHLYGKPLSGKNKNDYFREMSGAAHERGFRPSHILLDSWYSSLENLKLVRECGWVWLTQFRCNRHMNPDGGGNVRVDAVEIPTEGREAHLRGYDGSRCSGRSLQTGTWSIGPPMIWAWRRNSTSL